MENSSYYKYCYFDKDNLSLYHEISEENFGTKETFVFSMSYFITHIHKYRPKSLIIKILKKKPDYFELTMNSFMQPTLYKVINDINVEKIAFFLLHKEYYNELKVYERDDSLKVKFFLDIEEAKQWVINQD